MLFKDRRDAGRKLVARLQEYKGEKDVVVIGLPRGGVITASEVAKELGVPLDIVVPRKIGAPGHEEFAIGALCEEGDAILDQNMIDYLDISERYVNAKIAEEKKEAQRRLKLYRGDREPLDLKEKAVIMVDDGIATGHTMRAAIASTKRKGAKKVIVAVPVTAKDSLYTISEEADKIIYLDAPMFFDAIGRFYQVFDQTEDEEVIEIMKNQCSQNVPYPRGRL